MLELERKFLVKQRIEPHQINMQVHQFAPPPPPERNYIICEFLSWASGNLTGMSHMYDLSPVGPQECNLQCTT